MTTTTDERLDRFKNKPAYKDAGQFQEQVPETLPESVPESVEGQSEGHFEGHDGFGYRVLDKILRVHDGLTGFSEDIDDLGSLHGLFWGAAKVFGILAIIGIAIWIFTFFFLAFIYFFLSKEVCATIECVLLSPLAIFGICVALAAITLVIDGLKAVLQFIAGEITVAEIVFCIYFGYTTFVTLWNNGMAAVMK